MCSGIVLFEFLEEDELMALLFDVVVELPEEYLETVKAMVRSMMLEKPLGLEFVRIKEFSNPSQMQLPIVGKICHVMFCTLGGTPLFGHQQFLLFRISKGGALMTHYLEELVL